MWKEILGKLFHLPWKSRDDITNKRKIRTFLSQSDFVFVQIVIKICHFSNYADDITTFILIIESI